MTKSSTHLVRTSAIRKVLEGWTEAAETLERHQATREAEHLRTLAEEIEGAITRGSRGSVSVAEAAKHWDVDESTVQKWCRTGDLPAEKPGGEWRIPIDALDGRPGRTPRSSTL